MNKLILTIGIQGSGKSFWSKKWAEEDPENIVKHIFNEGLNYAMSEGKDIVIDNFSNLNPKHQKEYEELVNSFNA